MKKSRSWRIPANSFEGEMAKKKKNKRAKSIITGHLEKIGQKVFTDYSSAITELIKGHQGIYALYKKDKLYYVGLASNLKNRIKHHLNDRHKNGWTHFSLYIIRQEEHIKEIESLVLRISYPKGNAIKGKLIQSRDLRPILKSKMREQWEKQFNDIIGGRKTKPDKKTVRKITNHKADRPLKGLLKNYQRIYCQCRGQRFKAKVLPSGIIELVPGKERFNSPSLAGIAVTKKKTINGWKFWKYKDQNGNLLFIDQLRKGQSGRVR
jgi:Restriction Enzyme Adenine Methylase Associated/GIY-YIG catalytic domain